MKDLTHYFQSPDKVVKTNISSIEDCVIVESPSLDSISGNNGSVSPCFEGTCKSECNETGNSQSPRACEPEECQVKENSSAARNGRKCSQTSVKPAGYVNGISDCNKGQDSEQLGENPRKESKKKASLENGCVASDGKSKHRVSEDLAVDSPVSPNAFQILMSTQQVFSSTNSGRKSSPQEIVENGELKRESKKKIKENLEQMAKRKLEMEATIQACENTLEKSAKKRRKIIVESDSENEATSVPDNCLDAIPDTKPRKQRKSDLKVEIKKKKKKNVSDEIAIQVLRVGGGVKTEESNNKVKNELTERNIVNSKNMKRKVGNKHDIRKQNTLPEQSSTDNQNSTLEMIDKEDSGVIINLTECEKLGDSDTSTVIGANDTSEITKKKGNILNYFNKVTSDVKQRHIEKIKVTADIHFPVVTNIKVPRKVVTKKRSKRKDPQEDDIQLIDTEIIEKQNLPDPETKIILDTSSETKVPCVIGPPVKRNSECEVTASQTHKDWKIRIRIGKSASPSPEKMYKKCDSQLKKRKLKISGKHIKNESSPKVTLKETNDVLLSSNKPKTEESKTGAPGKKNFSSKSTPVKSKCEFSRDKDVFMSEDKQLVDKINPTSKRRKEISDNQSSKIKNPQLESIDTPLKAKRSTREKVPTPKGKKTVVAEKTSSPTLDNDDSVKKRSFKKNEKGDEPTTRSTPIKNTMKRKCSLPLQDSPPTKKSDVKNSPIKKSPVKNKSPVKCNLVKKENVTSKRVMERDENILVMEESPKAAFAERTNNFVKKEIISSKRNIGKEPRSRKKDKSSLPVHENNSSSEEQDETPTLSRAKRSCTKKNTTYTEDDTDSPKKSRIAGTTTSGRKRSITSRISLQEEKTCIQSSKKFESISSSAGRRSSPRKKSVSLITDYGFSDEDDDEDFDNDSDDDFFGDSDDYLDSEFGDSDEQGDKWDNYKEVYPAFDLKKKNDNEIKVTSRRKCDSHKEKWDVFKSLSLSKKQIEIAFREKIALNRAKKKEEIVQSEEIVPSEEIPSEEVVLDQEVVLQFLKKAKGILNRKMALHDPENVSSEQTETGKKSAPVKLAPVFVSQKTKKPDKATLLARKTFLQSGVPEVVKKMVEIQKLAEEQDHIEFPSISHIQQKEENKTIWNLSDALQKFAPSTEISVPTSLKIPMGEFTKCSAGSASATTYSASHPPKIKMFRDFLRCIKAESPDFPVYRTFKYLFEASRPQQSDAGKGNVAKRAKRRSSLAKKMEQAKNVQNSEHKCAAWTAKYQPLSSENILGNGYNISRFKKWLELWVQVNENTFQKNFKEDMSSGDEFLNDASDDESGRTVLPKKSVVLVGPTGSGKTMTVYALAHELGYKVLEVNAATKRTGRRILSELLEATQSHQVQGKGEETSGIKNFFTSKGTSEKSEHSKKEPEQQISKLSLILVEDVDVVFEEEDEGFVSALSTLVVGSKRPVVLVTSDPSCPHLPRFMENSLVLEFKPAPSKMISVWMQLVALLEGVRVRKSSVEELLRFNKDDIRKTLLQLQFWVLSGGDISKSLSESPHVATEIQDFPDDVSNSSWISIDDKKAENETHHPLHSQCLSTFLELDAQILSIDRGKIWWNAPKVAGLNEVSHKIKTNEGCQNEFASVAEKVITIEEASLESESTVRDENETKKKWKSVCSTKDIKVLLQLTDTLSMVEMLSTATDCVGNEPYQCAWETDPQNSLSLSQDMRQCSYGTKHTAQSIGNWLISACVNQSSSQLCPDKHVSLANVIQQQPPSEEMRWREQQHNANREFEDAVAMLYWPHRRGMATDYISSLRNISRLEQDRVSVNDKRNNRFFHYLRGLGAHPSSTALDTACKVFKNHNCV